MASIAPPFHLGYWPLSRRGGHWPLSQRDHGPHSRHRCAAV